MNLMNKKMTIDHSNRMNCKICLSTNHKMRVQYEKCANKTPLNGLKLKTA